jgi:hypothetical protein
MKQLAVRTNRRPDSAMPNPIERDNYLKTLVPLPDSLGTIVLDSMGCIRLGSSSLAELTGLASEEISGKPIRLILPGLPLQASTPGYNLAYAAFHARASHWMPMQLAVNGGGAVAVTVLLRLLRTDGGILFRLDLKRSETLQETRRNCHPANGLLRCA